MPSNAHSPPDCSGIGQFLGALHYNLNYGGFIRTQLVRPNHSGMAILFHGLLEKSPCGSLISLFDDEALQELSGRLRKLMRCSRICSATLIIGW